MVMLNRVIEKGSVSGCQPLAPGGSYLATPRSNVLSVCPTPQVKCAQYWPQREDGDSVFQDTNFKLTFVSEDVKSYYTVRQLELENLTVSV